MKIKARASVPFKDPNGSWRCKIQETVIDIPDLGREPLICNDCGWPDYPNCKKDCDYLKAKEKLD